MIFMIIYKKQLKIVKKIENNFIEEIKYAIKNRDYYLNQLKELK
jgi:hypothetical protein